jgi:hypothetical protein
MLANATGQRFMGFDEVVTKLKQYFCFCRDCSTLE